MSNSPKVYRIDRAAGPLPQRGYHTTRTGAERESYPLPAYGTAPAVARYLQASIPVAVRAATEDESRRFYGEGPISD